MILIYPPLVKPCEPPAGIAKLAGVLRRHHVACRIVDANLEGLLSLMSSPDLSQHDTWTRRAVRHLSENLASLRNWTVYQDRDRYKRAVMDVNRVLQTSGNRYGLRLTLANYQHRGLSPVRSTDLIRVAETPELDPFFPYFSVRLRELIEREHPTAAGFSLNFLSQALTTFAMLGYLHREFPSIKRIVGGGLITSWMRNPGWQNPFGGLVDQLVDGPGEGPLLTMAGVSSPEQAHCTPDYNGFPTNDYLAPGLILPYSASSGCYWNRCAFCPERAEGNPYLPTPIRHVLEDLDHLVKETRPVLIHLLDNAVSPALMTRLIDHQPGAPWYGFARIAADLADLDFCRALRRSGCVMLKLGIESGDQEVIDREQKGIDLRLAASALRALKEAGIATYVYLLFGTPSETAEAARRTLDFTVRHAECIDFLNLAIFNMPIYGPEAQQVETQALYEGDLSLYTGFVHPKGWNRGKVRQFLDKEFKRHPSVAAILRNDPPFFTSNHAPFLGPGMGA